MPFCCSRRKIAAVVKKANHDVKKDNPGTNRFDADLVWLNSRRLVQLNHTRLSSRITSCMAEEAVGA